MSGEDDNAEAAAYVAAHLAGMADSTSASAASAEPPGRTRVVNIRREACDVYIGRAGHGLEGYFGNPIRRGMTCIECGRKHVDNASTIRCYATYFARRIQDDAEFRRRVLALRGLRLGCFCIPVPCHGQVIARWLNDLPD